MAEEVGRAFVSLVPSARGFSAKAQREIKSEMAGKDISIPVTPDIDRAAVTRALTGATAGQRSEVQVRTDVDATQLLGETRGAVRTVQATRPTVHVRTDVDRRSLSRSLTGFSSAGGSAGKAFSGGFGTSLIDPKTGLIIAAVSALLPPVVALVAPVALAGASLATIFVGGFALRANPQLKKAVEGLFSDIDKGLTKAAQPLVKPFLEAIGILRQTAKDLAPDLRELFAAVAPYIPQLAEGVSGFMKAFTPGLVKAVKDSAPVIEKLSWALPDLGAALGDFLSTMAEVAPEAGVFFGQFIRFTADLIRDLGNLVAFMVKLMDDYIRGVKLAWDIVTTIVSEVGHSISGLGIIWDGAKRVWSEATSISDLFEAGLGALGATVSGLVGLFERGTNKIRQWWSQLWGKDLPQAVAGGTSSLVQTAQRIPGRITSALGNTKTLLWQAGRNMIQSLINGITSKFSGAGSLASVMSQAASMARSFWPFSPAKQGPLSGHGSLWYAGQNLVTDLTGGMSSRLPQIASASSQLASAVGARGTGGASTAAGGVVQIGSDGSRMGDLLIEVLRETIQFKGGNVQVVLGQNHG